MEPEDNRTPDEVLKYHRNKLIEATARLRNSRAAMNDARRGLYELRGINRNARYWAALGEFLEVFSQAEAVVFSSLRDFAGVSDKVARVIFAGTRVDLGTTYIRKLIELRRWKQSARQPLLRALDQLIVINKVRNDILHYGPDPNRPGKFVITNARRALARDKIREIYMPPTTLESMTADLRVIVPALLFLSPGNKSAIRKQRQGRVRAMLSDAWRYRPPSPAKSGRKSRKAPQKLQRQPRPSRE